MDTLQCAIVLAKLERFNWEVQQRIEIGQRYNVAMDRNSIPRVQQRADRSSVFAQYTIFVEDRNQAQESLKKAGIPTAVHYPFPLNQQPVYQGTSCTDPTPNSRQAAKLVMSLPMGTDLQTGAQAIVIETLRSGLLCRY